MSDYQDKRSKTWSRLNAIRHFFFGVLLIALAVYVFKNHQVGNIDFGVWGSYIFGGLMVVYGLFRIWRGFIDLRNDGSAD